MSVWLALVMLIIGLVLLIKGADFLVEGASALALRMSVSEIAVGLTVVAFGTSAPEFVVSLGRSRFPFSPRSSCLSSATTHCSRRGRTSFPVLTESYCWFFSSSFWSIPSEFQRLKSRMTYMSSPCPLSG